MSEPFEDLNPAPRLLMGPGPINADPRVLRAETAALAVCAIAQAQWGDFTS